MISRYISLTKPGIIRGNLLTAIAGFMLASQGNIHAVQLVSMLVGLGLIIASGCVVNNIIDRDIDRHMQRTAGRALVTGDIRPTHAAVFAFALGLGGAAFLVFGTNILTLVIALFGHFAYVILYGIGKRRTVCGTLIGSISGADVPPVVGYAAVANRLDTASLLLFIILVAWQMPHFYAIAIFRSKEYKAARIPVLPLVKGTSATIKQILAFMIVFILSVPLLTVAGYTGILYAVLMSAVGIWWLWTAVRGLKMSANDKSAWAKSVFLRSILILPLFAIAVAVDSFL